MILQVLAWLALAAWLTVGYLSAGPAVAAAYRWQQRTEWQWPLHPHRRAVVPVLVVARAALVLSVLGGPVTWLVTALAGDRALRSRVPEYDRQRTAEENRSLADSIAALGQQVRQGQQLLDHQPLPGALPGGPYGGNTWGQDGVRGPWTGDTRRTL